MQTQVLIIGAGITGAGLARDLAMRGVPCLVVDKQDANAGASGANHGLLHSGARYIALDRAAARECQSENRLLKRLAPHCIEDTGGLFVAVVGDDETYAADFPDRCRRCGIDVSPVDARDALEMEPVLSNHIIAAYEVGDAAIDPFKLTLNNIADARRRGGTFLRDSRVIGFDVVDGRIRKTILRGATGSTFHIEADVVVNAAGAWAGMVAELAGVHIGMRLSKGSLLVTDRRITRRVINRLRRAASGDILVPGGTVSILGTTSERVDSPDRAFPEIHEVDAIIDEMSALIPILPKTRYIRAYCGVRPLVDPGGATVGVGNDRTVSRGFALIDHVRPPEKIANFVTITGGKLTTYRLMAEKTADLVCKKIGVTASCRTRIEPLPDTDDARWTHPGSAPFAWLRKHDPEDLLVCDCEMVPQSVLEEIVAANVKHRGKTDLKAVGLHSRFGKGTCQGTFCSLRLAAHLYNRGDFAGRQGIAELRAFLRERWRGQRTLLWDTPLAQAELLEALHCGLFGLELEGLPACRDDPMVSKEDVRVSKRLCGNDGSESQ